MPGAFNCKGFIKIGRYKLFYYPIFSECITIAEGFYSKKFYKGGSGKEK
jgi:hypothetical protein